MRRREESGWSHWNRWRKRRKRRGRKKRTLFFSALFGEDACDGLPVAGLGKKQICGNRIKRVIMTNMELWGNKAIVKIEDQGDRAGMFRRKPKKNADTRTFKPAIRLGILLLECIVEDIGGTAEGVECGKIGCDVANGGKGAQGTDGAVASRVTANVGSIAEGECPEIDGDGGRPVVFSEKKHAAG